VARASAKQLSLCTAASVALGVALGPRAWAQQPSLPQIGGVIGGWWRFLHGNFGTMMAGASYSYVRKSVFKGVGGSPYANEQIFMVAFRYYPFE
jgi:hypothetical protein